jgi:hypothetical protein
LTKLGDLKSRFVGKYTHCGPALSAHGSLDLKQEIQIQIQIQIHALYLGKVFSHNGLPMSNY